MCKEMKPTFKEPDTGGLKDPVVGKRPSCKDPVVGKKPTEGSPKWPESKGLKGPKDGEKFPIVGPKKPVGGVKEPISGPKKPEGPHLPKGE